MTYQTENRALKRLSECSWKDDGRDSLTMEGYFNPEAVTRLTDDLGKEARDALGLVFIAQHTKAVMRKSQAEKLFALERLPLNVLTVGRTR